MSYFHPRKIIPTKSPPAHLTPHYKKTGPIKEFPVPFLPISILSDTIRAGVAIRLSARSFDYSKIFCAFRSVLHRPAPALSLILFPVIYLILFPVHSPVIFPSFARKIVVAFPALLHRFAPRSVVPVLISTGSFYVPIRLKPYKFWWYPHWYAPIYPPA